MRLFRKLSMALVSLLTVSGVADAVDGEVVFKGGQKYGDHELKDWYGASTQIDDSGEVYLQGLFEDAQWRFINTKGIILEPGMEVKGGLFERETVKTVYLPEVTPKGDVIFEAVLEDPEHRFPVYRSIVLNKKIIAEVGDKFDDGATLTDCGAPHINEPSFATCLGLKDKLTQALVAIDLHNRRAPLKAVWNGEPIAGQKVKILQNGHVAAGNRRIISAVFENGYGIARDDKMIFMMGKPIEGGTPVGSDTEQPVYNKRGDFVMLARMEDGNQGIITEKKVIVRQRKVFHDLNITTLGTPILTEDGRAIFRARWKDNEGRSGSGILDENGKILVRNGDVVGGKTLRFVHGSPKVNSRGDLIFAADYTDNSGPEPKVAVAIFKIKADAAE